jgi:hypothetical protein
MHGSGYHPICPLLPLKKTIITAAKLYRILILANWLVNNSLSLSRGEGTYAEVAVNISTFFACVTRLKHRAKQAVNATKIARRVSVFETK